MYSVSSMLVALLVNLALTAATPIPEPAPSALEIAAPKDLEARAVSIPTYGCFGINWRGECETFWIISGTCLTLNSHWARQISSFGPPSSATYYIYAGAGCGASGGEGEHGMQVNYSGYANLVPSGWNDKIVSISCYPK